MRKIQKLANEFRKLSESPQIDRNNNIARKKIAGVLSANWDAALDAWNSALNEVSDESYQAATAAKGLDVMANTRFSKQNNRNSLPLAVQIQAKVDPPNKEMENKLAPFFKKLARLASSAVASHYKQNNLIPDPSRDDADYEQPFYLRF